MNIFLWLEELVNSPVWFENKRDKRAESRLKFFFNNKMDPEEWEKLRSGRERERWEEMLDVENEREGERACIIFYARAFLISWWLCRYQLSPFLSARPRSLTIFPFYAHKFSLWSRHETVSQSSKYFHCSASTSSHFFHLRSPKNHPETWKRT